MLYEFLPGEAFEASYMNDLKYIDGDFQNMKYVYFNMIVRGGLLKAF